jgi:hypothetical protein
VIGEPIGIPPQLSLSLFGWPRLIYEQPPSRIELSQDMTMKAPLDLWITRLPALLRALGPYAAIELLLPGGSLIALGLWLYRQWANVGVRT